MPNNVNTNTWSSTYKDYGGESSTVRHGVRTFADNAAYVAAETSYQSGLDGLLIGSQQNIIASLASELSSANASEQAAQREIRLEVKYADSVTGKGYRVTYPCLDLSIASLVVAGSDFINRELAAVQAFETAFEAFVASPDGNAVTISSMRFVGRNS